MDAAIKVIKKQIHSFDGCELHSLSEMYDERNDRGRLSRNNLI